MRPGASSDNQLQPRARSLQKNQHNFVDSGAGRPVIVIQHQSDAMAMARQSLE